MKLNKTEICHITVVCVLMLTCFCQISSEYSLSAERGLLKHNVTVIPDKFEFEYIAEFVESTSIETRDIVPIHLRTITRVMHDWDFTCENSYLVYKINGVRH